MNNNNNSSYDTPHNQKRGNSDSKRGSSDGKRGNPKSADSGGKCSNAALLLQQDGKRGNSGKHTAHLVTTTSSCDPSDCWDDFNVSRHGYTIIWFEQNEQK